MANIEKQMKNAISTINSKVTEYRVLGNMSVDVGLPSDRIHGPSGLTLAELGAIHEFGLNEVPERSFLRSVIILKKEEIKNAMTLQAEKAAGGDDPKVLMEQFSLFGQGIVQENIVELKNPPLKRKRKDGSDNPLNDTGEMKQGIIGIVVSD